MTETIKFQPKRIGVWIIGIYGNISSLVIGGTELLTKGFTNIGVLTESKDFEDLDILPLDQIVFGGHDIRQGSILESFMGMSNDAHLDKSILDDEFRDYIDSVEKNVRIGSSIGTGKVMSKIAISTDIDSLSLSDIINNIIKDIQEFKDRNNLETVIVVNLSSTEPPISTGKHTETIEGFLEAINNNRKDLIKASNLYAYASIFLKSPYINFTPSSGASIPPLIKFAEIQKVPLAGNDGKTGETLIKSILALVFHYRRLKVLAWQSYNILGNMDGKVLQDPESKKSKEITKDAVVPNILGYRPYTHVGIDYVPPLRDWKVAWDYIHFEGFLGTKMNMQFTWQGCDSILAAPLVIDLIRLVELSNRRGEYGILTHLAPFFKQPLGTDISDLPGQWNLLTGYLKELKK